MDNSMKALIIAGTVLISVLLISAGVFIINNSKDTTDQSKTAMSKLEVQEHNKKIEKYLGKTLNYNDFKYMITELASMDNPKISINYENADGFKETVTNPLELLGKNEVIVPSTGKYCVNSTCEKDGTGKINCINVYEE